MARAVTDSDTGPDAVRHEPADEAGREQPAGASSPRAAGHPGGGADVTTYGAAEEADDRGGAVVLEPLQGRYAELAADPAYVDGVFAAGSARCREETAPVLAAARAAIGLS